MHSKIIDGDNNNGVLKTCGTTHFPYQYLLPRQPQTQLHLHTSQLVTRNEGLKACFQNLSILVILRYNSKKTEWKKKNNKKQK